MRISSDILQRWRFLLLPGHKVLFQGLDQINIELSQSLSSLKNETYDRRLPTTVTARSMKSVPVKLLDYHK